MNKVYEHYLQKYALLLGNINLKSSNDGSHLSHGHIKGAEQEMAFAQALAAQHAHSGISTFLKESEFLEKMKQFIDI